MESRLQKIKALPDFGRDVGQAQQINPGRSQLHPKWHPVHQAADAGQIGQIVGPQGEVGPDALSTLDEETDGGIVGSILRRLPIGELKPLDREKLLRAQMQSLAGGDQDFDLRCGPQDIADQINPGEEMLEVVQHQQHALRAQVIKDLLSRRARSRTAAFQLKVKGVGHSRHDMFGGAEWG